MTKELNFIIQGNYGQGWEDVSWYSCGHRQANYYNALKSCNADFKNYKQLGYPHRIIKRYEAIKD